MFQRCRVECGNKYVISYSFLLSYILHSMTATNRALEREMFILQCRSGTLKLDSIETHKSSDVSQPFCSSQVFMENGFIHEADPWSNRFTVCYLRISPLRPRASNFCHARVRGIKMGSVVFRNYGFVVKYQVDGLKVDLLVFSKSK